MNGKVKRWVTKGERKTEMFFFFSCYRFLCHKMCQQCLHHKPIINCLHLRTHFFSVFHFLRLKQNSTKKRIERNENDKNVAVGCISQAHLQVKIYHRAVLSLVCSLLFFLSTRISKNITKRKVKKKSFRT